MTWSLKLNIDYDNFDCPRWFATYASTLGAPAGAIRIGRFARGSVDLAFQGSPALASVVDPSVAQLSNGPASFAGVPATSGVDTQGRAFGVSPPPPWWIIGLVLGVVVFVVLLVLLIIFLVKRRQKNSKRKDPSAATMAKLRKLEAAAKSK